MWGRHAALVVASNLLAAGLLLTALLYFWSRGSNIPRGFLHEYQAHRVERTNCARTCVKNEEHRECYYEFVIRPQVIMDLSCGDEGQNSSNCISRIKTAPRRMVFAINGQVPGPPIEVCQGDVVVVDVVNRLPGQQVSLHWHGLRQLGTPHMDGVSMVTQCPVPAGSRFRYVFRASDPGTHLYHAHAVSQQAAGVVGSVVVRQSLHDDPAASMYDHDLQEHTVLLSILLPIQGSAPQPTISISGKVTKGREVRSRARFRVLVGRRYRLRLIGAAAVDCPMLLSLDQHQLHVFSKDGNPTSPLTVQHLVIFPGERYDVVLKANQPASTYKLRVKGYNYCSEVYEEAELVYHTGSSNKPVAEDILETTDEEIKQNFLEKCPDVMECLPALKAPGTGKLMPDQPDLRFYLPFDVNPVGDLDGRVDFRYLHEGAPYYPAYLSREGGQVAQFNNVSFMYPASPLLSQARDVDAETLCREDASGRPLCAAHHQAIFCECTRLLRVPLYASAELVLVDLGHGSNASRTFHLHGHVFRVLGSRSLGRPLGQHEVQKLDARGQLERDLITSPTMDTAVVPNKGYSVWRLHADNPGKECTVDYINI